MYVAQYIMVFMGIVAIDRFRNDPRVFEPVKIQGSVAQDHQKEQMKNGYLKTTLSLEGIDQELCDLAKDISRLDPSQRNEELESLIVATKSEFEDLKDTLKTVDTEKVHLKENEVVIDFQIEDIGAVHDYEELSKNLANTSLSLKVSELSTKIDFFQKCLQTRKIYLKSTNEKFKKIIERLSQFYEGSNQVDTDTFDLIITDAHESEATVLARVPFVF